MCTSITFRGLFGRTLDLDCSYGESVALTPRNFPMTYRHLPPDPRGYALLGTAHVAGGVPLYYEAMNEKGLGMAGLNFPKFGAYLPAKEGKTNAASFELIPLVLRRCATLAEARQLCQGLNITDDHFAPGLPPRTLHWVISDGRECFVMEQTAEGLHLYDDPAGVLTNSPTFPEQTALLGSDLPGGWSSSARFLRAAWGVEHGTEEGVSGFFRLMDTVTMPGGLVKTAEGTDMVTQYTCCCDLAAGVYHYTTAENRAITAASFHREELEGCEPVSWPHLRAERVTEQN